MIGRLQEARSKLNDILRGRRQTRRLTRSLKVREKRVARNQGVDEGIVARSVFPLRERRQSGGYSKEVRVAEFFTSWDYRSSSAVAVAAVFPSRPVGPHIRATASFLLLPNRTARVGVQWLDDYEHHRTKESVLLETRGSWWSAQNTYRQRHLLLFSTPK